jgi:hypothetical protein
MDLVTRNPAEGLSPRARVDDAFEPFWLLDVVPGGRNARPNGWLVNEGKDRRIRVLLRYSICRCPADRV